MKYVMVFLLFLTIFANTTLAESQFPVLKGKEIEKTVENFFHVWLVEQDINKALAFLDFSSINVQIQRTSSCPLHLTKQDLRRLLVMWLAKDHGLVNLTGHGDPCKPGFLQLPIRPEGFPERYHWKEANLAVEIISHGTNEGSSAHGIAFKFRHLPYDVLYIELDKRGRNWKIIGFSWLVG